MAAPKFRESVRAATVERLVCLVALGFLAAGCGPKHARRAGAVLAASAAELRPDASPGTAASLRLGTGDGGFEVALRESRKGPELALEMLSGGETLEREVYRSEGGAFGVARAGDDAFRPAIDLLRFPLREGDAWAWKGKVAYAGASRVAHAEVAVVRDGQDVRSDVALFVANDPGRPELKRSLSFWFRKGRGGVGRRFGDVSSRFPQGEPWRP